MARRRGRGPRRHPRIADHPRRSEIGPGRVGGPLRGRPRPAPWRPMGQHGGVAGGGGGREVAGVPRRLRGGWARRAARGPRRVLALAVARPPCPDLGARASSSGRASRRSRSPTRRSWPSCSPSGPRWSPSSSWPCGSTPTGGRRRASGVAGEEGEQGRLGTAGEAHGGVGRGAEARRDVQPRGVRRRLRRGGGAALAVLPSRLPATSGTCPWRAGCRGRSSSPGRPTGGARAGRRACARRGRGRPRRRPSRRGRAGTARGPGPSSGRRPRRPGPATSA